MGLTFIDTFPGRPTRFDLTGRQEYSRHASGVTRSKDLGDAIWIGEWTSKPLHVNDTDYWKAVLEECGLRQTAFNGWKRKYPILHPNGTGIPGPITVNVVAGNTISLSGATGLHLSIGDYVLVAGTDLYRVMTASDNGAAFTCSPLLWLTTIHLATVSVIKAAAQMIIAPGSVAASIPLNGRSTITFQGMETRG